MTPSPAPGRPRVWPVFVTFVVACLLLVVVEVAVLAALGRGHGGALSLSRFLISALTAQVVLAGTVLVSARPFTAARLRLRWGGTSVSVLVAAALGALALGQVLDCALTLAGLQDYGSLAAFRRVIAGIHGPDLVKTLLVVGLLAGAAEELFFRGYMQTRLSQRFRPSTAVLITSALFGLLHFDLLHSPLAFALGVWLGVVAERTDSLIPSITGHAVNNAVVTLSIASQLTIPGTRANLVVLVVSFLLLVVCARILFRRPSAVVPRLEPTAAA